MKRSNLHRRALLPRPTEPLARSPMTRANRQRKAETFARAYGGAERADWITRQPSVVSGEGPCVNAHVRTGGAGRKADARWVVPLTDAEHRTLHQIGQKSFEAKYGIDLAFLAQIIAARWEVYRTQTDLFTTPREGEE